MSDLMSLTPQKDTIKVELINPVDGKPLSHDKKVMWVERLLPHTGEYKKSQYKRSQKYIKAAQKSGNGGDVDIDLYQAEEDRIEIMAETTVAWNIYFGGEWIKYTPEMAKEIYTKAFWIAEQLQIGENEANVFTKG